MPEGQGMLISGNACPRGEAYARAELTHPTRVLTSTVRVEGAAHRRCPVKTAGAVPKESLFEIMRALDGVTLHAPVKAGATVLADVCGTGIDIVTTRGFARIEGENGEDGKDEEPVRPGA